MLPPWNPTLTIVHTGLCRGGGAAQRGDEELDVNWTVTALLGGLYLPLKCAALATVREKMPSQTVIAVMEQTNGLCPH